MVTRIAILLVCTAAGLAAQSNDKLEAITLIAGHARQLRDPVIVAWSLARLGSLACGEDRAAGADLYRDALSRVRLLTPDSFTSARHRLPVPSFTVLWRSVSAEAVKCGPELAGLVDADRAQAKMQQERQQANDNLRQAFGKVEGDPDRAAHLAETAMTSSYPMLLDIPMLTLLLSQLRERAPDVADELFPEALDFIASDGSPSPGLLLELGKYLFTSSKYLELPDQLQGSETLQVGDTQIANFSLSRKSTSSVDVHDYIDAALKVINARFDVNYDPVAAYAIAYQMLPKAEDVAPDLVDDLRKALTQLTSMAGSSAAQVQAAVGGAQAADAEGGEGPRLRDRIAAQVLAAAAQQEFKQARDLARRVDDQPVRGQLNVLVDFAEAGTAAGKRDVQVAFSLSNTLRGGVKRSLLYAGIAAASGSRDEALGYLQLGLKDLESLPAEQRMVTLAALAGAIFRIDSENALLATNMLVTAANDAYASPHKGRFDPSSVRKYSKGAATSDDSALILANRRCVCEVVDTGRGRHYFTLKVPGVDSRQLADVLRNAKPGDFDRLLAMVFGLRDETSQAAALVALAARRVGQ
jgi:hypothetical protein